jgi:hypothetical protein
LESSTSSSWGSIRTGPLTANGASARRCLLSFAIIGGWWGLFAGMYAFHHKTDKILFIGIAILIFALWFYILNHLVAMYGSPFVPP